jgi:hypothetical protein
MKMAKLNQRIVNIEVPDRMRKLKISDEGYPVPWFVPWVDGKPEFRGMDSEKFKTAVRLKRCWLCGEQLGKFMVFVIGPMCSVNRVSAEPPCHRSCAEYAARACPFLSQPKMRRNETDAPWDQVAENKRVAGIMIKRNPGVTLLWATEKYTVFRTPGGPGVLFRMGNPESVEFYAEGRKATRKEIMHSIESGLPELHKLAIAEGPESVAALEKQVVEAIKLVPKDPHVQKDSIDNEHL